MGKISISRALNVFFPFPQQQNKICKKMKPSTSKLFLPTEYATAEELIEFADDIERFSYEYLIIYQLLDKTQVLVPQLMEQSMRFLIKRHPNFMAYYVKNPDGSLERKYHDYDERNGKVFIQFDNIKFSQISDYVRERRKLETFTSVPYQRYYFAKTQEHYYIMSYSHHAFKDVLIDQIIMQELLSIYYELVKNPKASFEQATHQLPKIASYDDVLLDFHKTNTELLEKLIVFLRPRFESYAPIKESPLEKNTTLCKAHKVFRIFHDSEAIINKTYKPNMCLMTLVLLSLQKNFNYPGTLPVWKLNGSRPKVAEGVLCSYIKDQAFIHPLNPKNTFKMQYEQNYCHNKQSLIMFNHCDYAEALQLLSKQLGKDCIPKVCFNFYMSNQASKLTYGHKELSDEYDVVNSIMNMYFDVMYDLTLKRYSITVYYKKHIFEDKQMEEVMEFIQLGYRYLHLISNVRIEELSLEYLRNIDKQSVKKITIAKPKL